MNTEENQAPAPEGQSPAPEGQAPAPEGQAPAPEGQAPAPEETPKKRQAKKKAAPEGEGQSPEMELSQESFLDDGHLKDKTGLLFGLKEQREKMIEHLSSTDVRIENYTESAMFIACIGQSVPKSSGGAGVLSLKVDSDDVLKKIRRTVQQAKRALRMSSSFKLFVNGVEE